MCKEIPSPPRPPNLCPLPSKKDLMFLQFYSRLFHPKDGTSTIAHSTEKYTSSAVAVDSSVRASVGVNDVPVSKSSFHGQVIECGNQVPVCSLAHRRPHAVYDGGFLNAQRRGVCIRIANGGAGQVGLIKAWADAFIKHEVAHGHEPFEIAWYLGDTTDSLDMLASGQVDFALTYNAAAEIQSMRSGVAVERIYAFRDHFILVGPMANPADLEDDDDIFAMFNKIVISGNRDVLYPPDLEDRPATRFLSRFDKSATNIKESHLFASIGQVPWALGYSKWYHQYPRFPKEALQAASLLSEYTLTDQGTWFSVITSQLKAYKVGSDDKPDDPLLNPAHLLYGARASGAHAEICRAFMDWVVSPSGGQYLVERFERHGRPVYSKAP